VNFLNRKNEADQRVYQLLSEKFQLFEGVFGASDEVLGVIESGVDFEKRIAGIYQQCRQTGEIKAAFDQLQQELNLEINEAMTHARRKLLENFDDEVREKLKVRNADTNLHLNKFEQQLMRLARHELRGVAEFIDTSSFRLNAQPDWVDGAEIPTGLYELPRRTGEAHLFRVNHPLGEAIVSRARSRALPTAEIEFDYSQHEGRISQIESLSGQAGWLTASLLSVDALGQSEDHLLVSGVTDEGTPLSNEVSSRLMTVGGSVLGETTEPDAISTTLSEALSAQQADIRRNISERNARFFAVEADKLDGWADDLKVGLERELKELDRRIKEARRAATVALALEEKLAGQKAVKALEAERSTRRRSLFDAQDKIDEQRTTLIAQIEGKLEQQIDVQPLFTIRWRLK
jgi:adenine-specific DNA-methyltransferase